MKEIIKNKKGTLLITVMTLTFLFTVILLGAISLALMQQKLNFKKIASTQALHIAEAGVNYYRWVLYHNHEDYCNNEVCKTDPANEPYGPFNYTDQSGTITGQYELYIIPPKVNGSTIVDIKSVGWTLDNPTVKRIIEVKCGIPSWSTYSTLCNADIRFGSGTETWGQIHSNNGIRFDGLSHNVISSSLYDYDDPDHSGGNEFAVHTHVAPTDPISDGNTPPLNVPERSDVFESGRELGAPVVSFGLLTSHLATMLTKASANGVVINNSGSNGYHLIITPVAGEANDSIEIRKVTSETASCGGRETHGIASEVFNSTITTPTNGIIYIKDKVWIEGQINEDRITIIASEDLANDTDIIIFDELRYTNYDIDSLGLIAERDISISLYSSNDFQVDAAMIAKEGRIGRNYYGSGCGANYIRNRIHIFGSIATKNRYGFAYSDGTGYQIRELEYNNNLNYAPPPHFPTTDEYKFISWKEY